MGLGTVCSKLREKQLFCSHVKEEISQINADANLSDFQIRQVDAQIVCPLETEVKKIR